MALTRAKRLEKRIRVRLNELGCTNSDILQWESSRILERIREFEGGKELLDRLFGKVRQSFPELNSWEELSTSQILDFCLGVDALMEYKGHYLVADVTANAGAVDKKLSMMKGFRKAFLSQQLGVTNFLVIRGSLHASASSIKVEVLQEALDKLQSDNFHMQAVEVI